MKHRNPLSGLSRREFVKKSAWGAAASYTLPAFLQQTLANLDARADTIQSLGEERPITIIVEMAGGNDALNTVVPFSNPIYKDARPTLSLDEQHGIHILGNGPSVTGAQEALALHPNLAGFDQLWKDGDLAIVNGVGYPNPNLSHFTSFDFWHSAMPNTVAKEGWLGRYFDSQCSGCDSAEAIEIAAKPTLALKSGLGISPSVSFKDPDAYNWRDLTSLGREATLEDLYRNLVGLDHPIDGGIDTSNETLSFVQRTAHSALISSASVRAANQIGGDLLYSGWPNTGLSRDLQLIAQLIKGGMPTSLYYVHQGGYDTHNNQVGGTPLSGRHFDLIKVLNDALGAFAEEMKLQGQWNRTLMMTFSEFGRKVIQNGSLGTDHGAAESLFVMGGGVNGGQFYGQVPDLAADARVKRDSMDYNVDFRTVYRTVLENWMQVPSSAIGDIFPSQPVNFNPLSFV